LFNYDDEPGRRLLSDGLICKFKGGLTIYPLAALLSCLIFAGILTFIIETALPQFAFAFAADVAASMCFAPDGFESTLGLSCYFVF